MNNALTEAREAFNKQQRLQETATKYFPGFEKYLGSTTADTASVETKDSAVKEQPKKVEKPKESPRVKVHKPERMKYVEKKSKGDGATKDNVQRQMQQNARKEEARLFLGSLPANDEPIVRQLSYGFSADPEALPSHDLKIMEALIKEASARLKTEDRSKVLKYIVSEGDKIGGEKRWRTLAVRWSM